MYKDSAILRHFKIILTLIVLVSVVLGMLLFVIGALVWTATQSLNTPSSPESLQLEPASIEDYPQDSIFHEAGCPCWVKNRGSINEELLCNPLLASTPTPLNP